MATKKALFEEHNFKQSNKQPWNGVTDVSTLQALWSWIGDVKGKLWIPKGLKYVSRKAQERSWSCRSHRSFATTYGSPSSEIASLKVPSLCNNRRFWQLVKSARCGDSRLSAVPTLLWTVGSAALAHQLVSALFRRFLFRRVPFWEIILQVENKEN